MDKSEAQAVASIVAALAQNSVGTRPEQAGSDDAAMLSQLLLQQSVCQQLQLYLQQTLEFWPQRVASVSHVQQHELVIRCADGSAASRIRFIQNDLLQAVQAYANASADGTMRALLRAVSRVRVVAGCSSAAV